MEFHWVSSPIKSKLGLTCHPLQSGEILNLAGDGISNHIKKPNAGTRYAPFLKNGLCESLLHVPAFHPLTSGPKPVLLLSIQNKLNDSYEVIEADGAKKIFTDEDKEAAKELANEFKEALVKTMLELDMIGC